jgi:lysophospholipase L1-like esterase
MNISSRFLLLTLIVAPAFAGNATNYTYLALGDSIAFGYDPTVTAPTPAKYTGYPEVVAAALNLSQPGKEVNAACPGQTSGSFLMGGNDNGCQGFKDTIGLHTTYPGTQASFAVSQLLSNKHISLVTLQIGGNDLILLQLSCATPPSSFVACVTAGLQGTLQNYGANLTQILTELRVQAGYTGELVLVKYYVPNNDPLFILAIGALNQVMMDVGSHFGVTFADAFTSFQVASALFQGDPCAAGLLVRLSATTCDVHPSVAGRNLLAATVLQAIGDRRPHKSHGAREGAAAITLAILEVR